MILFIGLVVFGLLCAYLVSSASKPGIELKTVGRQPKPRSGSKSQQASVADIQPNQPSLELSINYYAGRSASGPVDWKTKVYGLGKNSNGTYFVIGHSYDLGHVRHFAVKSIRRCVDIESGEIITGIVAKVNAFNPVLYDMDAYFDKLEQEKDQHRDWLNSD